MQRPAVGMGKWGGGDGLGKSLSLSAIHSQGPQKEGKTPKPTQFAADLPEFLLIQPENSARPVCQGASATISQFAGSPQAPKPSLLPCSPFAAVLRLVFLLCKARFASGSQFAVAKARFDRDSHPQGTPVLPPPPKKTPQQLQNYYYYCFSLSFFLFFFFFPSLNSAVKGPVRTPRALNFFFFFMH